jgi:hypothetical protein
MPQVVIEGTYSITITWALAGTDWAVNQLHALIPSADSVDAALAAAWASDIEAAHVASGLQALQPTSVSLSRVDVRDLREPALPAYSAPMTSAGTSEAELLPRGTALVVTKRTNRAGPSYRGRIYIPGFSEEANETGGRATSAASAAALAFVEGLQDAATARGHTLAVASLYKAGSFDPSANPITQLEVRDNIWDGIRGRAFNGV